MRLVDLLRAVTVAACLSGCATASLRLVESGQVATPLGHVFIVVGQGPFDQSYADEVAGALVTALSEHTLTCRSRVLTGLELDDMPINEQMRSFGADGLLMLVPIGGMVNPANGIVARVVYKATFLDVHSDRVVWVAEIDLERGVFVASLGPLVAGRVVGSLIQQGIVRSGQPHRGGS